MKEQLKTLAAIIATSVGFVIFILAIPWIGEAMHWSGVKAQEFFR